MSNTTADTSLQDLQSFLEKLFQFENADLDFGIYKILNYKKAEIQHFVNTLLTEKVREQLNVLAGVETETFAAQLQEMEADNFIKGYNEAIADKDENKKNILLSVDKAKIEQYETLKEHIAKHHQTAQAEPYIYKHLALFFSRYYDKGDFISKRRYGKTEKYMVPYNGEETYFYWANADQYYIKSSEFFRRYAFRIPSATGQTIVNFKLKEAAEEQGNVRSEENKYFVLAETPVEATDDEVNIYFENRAITDPEKIQKGNTQEKLNDYAISIIKKALGKNIAVVPLFTENNGKIKISTELNRYTARNQYDFFIHKNLKAFLTRELDFYIKSELLKLDDLTVFDSETHLETVRLQFNVIKTFKNIATTIIDFISQIEDFQKKLWEKKKFVIDTHYVITLDKLAAFTSAEFSNAIMQEVIANAAQLQEWKELFGEEILPDWNNIDISQLKNDIGEYKPLPVDTQYFKTGDFRLKLLCEISKKTYIDNALNGIVIKSDNFHGLVLLEEKYQESINTIYIDPPYNTNASEIIYKNSFRNSSWLSLIQDRLKEGKKLLKEDGNLCVTIDDVEMKELSILVSNEFGSANIAGVVSIRANPSGRPTEAGFAIAHEYAIFAKNSVKSKIRKLPRTDAQLRRYNEKDNESIFEWRNFRREGSNSNREDGKRQWYPIYATIEEQVIRVPKMVWIERSEEWKVLEKSNSDEVIIYPITDEGIEKNWRWSEENVRNDYSQFHARLNREGVPQVYYKFRPNTDGVTPLTFWADAKYSATEHGTKTLKDLFKTAKFSYPKSIWAVKDCIYIMGNERKNLILDFFPGSGTTFHSVQLLNKEDEGERKCILIEQGAYVHTIIIPRIKKIAFTYGWSDGKPENQDGLGIFLKYQRLEQYEDCLENISFGSIQTLQTQLSFSDYIPKYFLHFETAHSNTFLNVDAMNDPFNYKLRVFNEYDYINQNVDLVETFNYLIGLIVQAYFISDHQERKYVFVVGTDRQNRNIIIIWRKATELNFEQDRSFIIETLQAKVYDTLYVNNQCAVEGALMIEEVFKTRMN